jgi:NADH-quinone oxidoreductase subunit G
VHSLHAVHDDWLMPLAGRLTVAPSGWLQALADVAAAVAASTGSVAPIGGELHAAAQAVAASLLGGERKAILLGNSAVQHPQAGALLALAQWIGEHTGCSVGQLGDAGNSVGAQLVGAMPGRGGLNAGQMLGAAGAPQLRACLLLNLDPVLDAASPAAARASLGAAELVVALSAFKPSAGDLADVVLPIVPFTETSGTFVNAEGRVQSFHGVVKPLGDARPAWKVLRVLGNMLGLEGFNFETSEEVRAQALGDTGTIATRLDNCSSAALRSASAAPTEERIADVPIYCTDPMVRRAPSLQLTADARPPVASLPAELWARLGLAEGAMVRVSQGMAVAELPARQDTTLAPRTVRVPAGHPMTASLGAMFGPIVVEKV